MSPPTVRLVALVCKVNQYGTQYVQEALELAGYRADRRAAAGRTERAKSNDRQQACSPAAGRLMNYFRLCHFLAAPISIGTGFVVISPVQRGNL